MGSVDRSVSESTHNYHAPSKNMTLTELLTDPNSFYDRATEDPSLLAPTLVVLLVGITGAVASLPQVTFMMDAMPEQAAGFGSIAVASAVIGGLLGPFLVWLFVTGVFHAISGLVYGGDGQFTTNLAMVGWGMVPSALGNLVSGAGNWYLMQDVTLPQNPDPQQVATIAEQMQSGPEFMILSLVGIAFTLWSAFIWTFAQRHARSLSLQEAAITVGAPVGLYVLLQVWWLV